VLKPKAENDGGSFLLSEMQTLARRINAYNIPIFVLFNPLPAKPGFDPETYTLYYRYARVIFQELAPKAAFVFGADIRLPAEELAAYYPGDNTADWAAAYFNDSWQDGKYDDEPLKTLTAFYQAFHEEKPVMLITGVSHFSTDDYMYRTAEAAERLIRFYHTTALLWPRIKLIVYRDTNDIAADESRRGKEVLDDFTISRDDELISAYREAVGHRRYVTDINMPGIIRKPGAARNQTGFRLSDNTALYAEGHIYIEDKVLSEMNTPLPVETTALNGKTYFEANKLDGTPLYAVPDYENKMVTIYRRLDGLSG
jgi:hypothetical protein